MSAVVLWGYSHAFCRFKPFIVTNIINIIPEMRFTTAYSLYSCVTYTAAAKGREEEQDDATTICVKDNEILTRREDGGYFY